MAEDKTVCGEFVVRESFRVTGKGTVVSGYVESGEVRTGDELRWIDGESTRHARCRGVSGIRQVPLMDPPSIVLLVDSGEPDDFIGVTLTVHR